MAKEKEHLNLAFIGHVDHGKSTLVGHLLLKAGAIAEQQLDDGENKFRFVMDKLGEERERGAFCCCNTGRRHFRRWIWRKNCPFLWLG